MKLQCDAILTSKYVFYSEPPLIHYDHKVFP